MVRSKDIAERAAAGSVMRADQVKTVKKGSAKVKKKKDDTLDLNIEGGAVLSGSSMNIF